MPSISFAKNKSAIALFGSDMEFTTDPVPLGGANYGQCSLNIESMFESARGSSLAWQIEGSNDGVIFQDVPSGSGGEGAAGLYGNGVELAFAFIRVKFTYSTGSSSGDWGAVVFDFRVNLLRK